MGELFRDDFTTALAYCTKILIYCLKKLDNRYLNIYLKNRFQFEN